MQSGLETVKRDPGVGDAIWHAAAEGIPDRGGGRGTALTPSDP